MKKILILLAVFTIGFTASAQTDVVRYELKDQPAPADSIGKAKTYYLYEWGRTGTGTANYVIEQTTETPKASGGILNPRGWYAGFNAGAQVYTGMTDKYLSFKDAVAPVGGFNVGRYVNNWLNIDLNLSIAQFKGLYTRPEGEKHFTTDRCFDPGTQRYYQSGGYIQCYARAGVDLNTLIAGYDENRRIAFVPYVGGGMATGFGKNSVGDSNSSIAPTIDYGLEFLARFSHTCAGVIDCHANAIGLQLENENCTVHTFHASYGVKLGLRFNLGK